MASPDDDEPEPTPEAGSAGFAFERALANINWISSINASTLAHVQDAYKFTMPKGFTAAFIPKFPSDFGVKVLGPSLVQQQLDAIRRSIVPAIPKLDFGWPQLDLFSKWVSGLDLDTPARWYPANWGRIDEADFDRIGLVTTDEGIPLAWVPGTQVFRRLLDAPDREARLRILVEDRDAILAACDDALAVERPDLIVHAGLARQAIEALRAGFREAAGSLAVNVAMRVVEAQDWKGDGKQLAKRFRVSGNISTARMLEVAARAPVSPFIMTFRPGDEHPETLTRNAVAHDITPEDLDEANCVIAIMLATSLLKSVDVMLERLEEARAARDD